LQKKRSEGENEDKCCPDHASVNRIDVMKGGKEDREEWVRHQKQETTTAMSAIVSHGERVAH